LVELRNVRAELFDLSERIGAAEDVLSRTDIRAPLAGTVVGL
jgi:multidrug resistance efflux pump